MANEIVPAAPLEISIELLGTLISNSIEDAVLPITLSLEGVVAISQVINVEPLEITFELKSLGTVVGYSRTPDLLVPGSNKRANWVSWSKIGELNFTIDQSNVAGERPLDWPGAIYELLKLDKSVIAYGENGVSVLTPAGLSYGLQTIYRIGIINKGAVAGDDVEHYFVDLQSRLFRLSGKGIQMLDYSEYIEKLINPILSLDPEFGLLYICDGLRGFVYSTRSESFGEGPTNITGTGSQGGTAYIIAPEVIAIPKFHICTDIYDLGTRKPKTVGIIEVGTNLTDDLHVRVEARLSNKLNFLSSVWKLVNPSGIAYVPCYGVEFKFHVKSYIYEHLELDYLKINGTIHEYTYLDQIS